MDRKFIFIFGSSCMFGTITLEILVEPSENSFLPFAGGNLLSTFRHGTVLFGMCVDEKVSSPGGPPKLWYYRNLAVAISHPTHSDNKAEDKDERRDDDDDVGRRGKDCTLEFSWLNASQGPGQQPSCYF
ncbi:hypothetical protein RUM43_009537 [Polyplax serrata]|uniref:Uncharacterized protein n=1 Tax=Polyplax serrata TaxID=468196 RepID=A0AAN8NVL3_POLSC